MGKPTASCFKIISCGGDSVDHDDLQAPESKDSSDRRRWSFRKRSAGHRVLSNSVSFEAPLSANKENPESPAVNFQVQPDLTVPAKTSVIPLAEEKTELPAQLDSKLADTLSTAEDNCKQNATLDEPSIIIIQAAIRRLLAQQVLLKQKNMIKLQAAVRGHIVRRHAVGTLRCVRSIIKMQALVRARRASRLDEGSGDYSKQSETSGKDYNELTLLGKTEAKSNHTYTYVSIEKLLTNAFARQLMELTPRTKPINIKCDPSKSDSAWKWLERWMSVSSVSSGGPPESGTEEQRKENPGHSDRKEDILVPSGCYVGPTDLTSGVGASVEASGRDASTLDLHSGKFILPSSSLSCMHNIDQLKNSTSDLSESASMEMKDTDSIEVLEVNQSLPENEETGNVRYVSDVENFSTEPKNQSRKASNPACIAAHSKFELSSVSTSPKLTSPSSHDLGVESCLGKVSSSTDLSIKSMDIGLADNASSAATSTVQVGSECGTELSISSTLDSPDRSEGGANDVEQETKMSGETEHPKSGENSELEANEKSIVLEADPSFANTNDLEICTSINSATVESLNSINVEDLLYVEKKQEAKPSDVQLELESEASPRSHLTILGSQATPSSQVSVKPKKSKGEKSESSSCKSKSLPADKTRNLDSVRSSLEQLPESKNGKRRNSFGSAKPDHKELEPRDSSSHNSLPSYMQATESARAKAIASGSPRSSPDMHEKDLYIKKRHSLPGRNERQGSPRIQRSLSQAQQNAKGNATHSPQDRKWRK